MDKTLILCDTDVIIDFFDKDKQRHYTTQEAVLPLFEEGRLAVSVITIMEVLSGLPNKEMMRRGVEQLSALQNFLLTPEISIRAMGLMQKYRLSHGMSIPDALIAATAIESKLPLFTYNQKHFKYVQNLHFWNIAE